eukprot:93719-Hanusia_phi.AAC.3
MRGMRAQGTGRMPKVLVCGDAQGEHMAMENRGGRRHKSVFFDQDNLLIDREPWKDVCCYERLRFMEVMKNANPMKLQIR